MSYYKIELNLGDLARSTREIFIYDRELASNLAHGYAMCEDIRAVEMVDMTTGEILFYQLSNGEIYEAL